MSVDVRGLPPHLNQPNNQQEAIRRMTGVGSDFFVAGGEEIELSQIS